MVWFGRRNKKRENKMKIEFVCVLDYVRFFLYTFILYIGDFCFYVLKNEMTKIKNEQYIDIS